MRLARSENRASRFGPRFPLHAVFALTGLGNERRNRVIPLQSTRFCSCAQSSFCAAAPFVSLPFFPSFGLRFFSFVRFRDGEDGGNRQREGMRNERATTPSGLVLPTLDRRLFYRRSPPNPVLPTRYIYVYMYIVYFRRCFAFVFRRTMKETLRTICSLYIFLVQRKRKEFSFARMGEPPRELFARKHDGGVE